MWTRRQLLTTGAGAVGAALWPASRAMASPLGLPLGLQLYSVRDQLAAGYDATLQRVAALGFGEVEAAGWFGHTAAQVKQAMQAAGLRCVSAHYNLQELNTDTKIESIAAFHHAIGAQYVVCPFPGFRDPARAIDPSSKVGVTFEQAVRTITLDDLRYTAGELNRIARRVHAAGLRFAYHNHTMEFTLREQTGPESYRTGFDELMRLTDPAVVAFELDCGWAAVSGGHPEELLHRYRTRICMLHLKDFKAAPMPATAANPPVSAELGEGTVDLRGIVAAADRQYVRHIFAEQEHFVDRQAYPALAVDAAYLKQMR